MRASSTSLPGSAVIDCILQPSADHHHAAIHFVGLRVLQLEIPPESAAHEPLQGLQAAVVVHLMGDPLVLDQLLGRQRPFGHLAITAIGQVDLADRRHVVDRLRRRGNLQPTLIGHQGVEKPAEPAVLVNVLLGFRPGAELLAVVAEQADRIGPLLREPRQVADRFFGRGKGNRVTQLLAAGEYTQHAAFVLGDQVALELRIGQAGHFEMKVVENGILDAGVDQVVGERLLPNWFGDPHSADRRAQAVLQPAGIAADLADAVAAGNHRQD